MMPVSLLVTAAGFIVAGVLHFTMPKPYLGIMPAWLPSPLTVVYVSGLLEIVGGAALLLPAARVAAAIGLIALLAAVFPANVEMLRLAQARSASTPFIVGCWLRLPLQPLLMWWVWRVAHAGRDLTH